MAKFGRIAALGASSLLFLSTAALAADMGGGMPPGHGGMGGAMQGGHGGMGGMELGEKLGGGAFGPWKSAVYLSDSRKALEHAKAKGAAVDMALSHHLMVMLLTQEGPPVLEGKGTVTVTGPGVKGKKYNLVSMQGHFGADLPLSKPGTYTLKVSIQAGKGKGEKTFTATVK